MRILVVLPAASGVYPKEAEDRRIRVIKSYASPVVEIDVVNPDAISGFNPFGGFGAVGYEMARNHMIMAERLIKGEEEGYDACIPFGMLDFGVDIARSRCRIPIVGQLQATLCMAAMMANRVGFISYESTGHANTYRQLREYGFLDLLVGYGAAEIPNNEMPRRREELFDRFVSEGKRLVKDGAELIVCHGMSMSPIEYPPQAYADAIGVPVLEGMGCAIAMAEAWVRIGTPYSPVRYPRMP